MKFPFGINERVDRWPYLINDPRHRILEGTQFLEKKVPTRARSHLEVIITVGRSGSCATEWSTLATLEAETESRSIKRIAKVDMPITASTGMKPLTGSRLIQNANAGKSDEFQTDVNSSDLLSACFTGSQSPTSSETLSGCFSLATGMSAFETISMGRSMSC